MNQRQLREDGNLRDLDSMASFLADGFQGHFALDRAFPARGLLGSASNFRVVCSFGAFQMTSTLLWVSLSGFPLVPAVHREVEYVALKLNFRYTDETPRRAKLMSLAGIWYASILCESNALRCELKLSSDQSLQLRKAAKRIHDHVNSDIEYESITSNDLKPLSLVQRQQFARLCIEIEGLSALQHEGVAAALQLDEAELRKIAGIFKDVRKPALDYLGELMFGGGPMWDHVRAQRIRSEYDALCDRTDRRVFEEGLSKNGRRKLFALAPVSSHLKDDCFEDLWNHERALKRQARR